MTNGEFEVAGRALLIPSFLSFLFEEVPALTNHCHRRMPTSFSDIIRRDCAAYAALHQQVRDAFARRGEGAEAFLEWTDATRRWHEFGSPMLQLERPKSLARLDAGDPETVEHAICFLEADPFYFRSGYLKSALIQRLKRIHLTSQQQGRLRTVVLQVLTGPRRRAEIRHYAQLAAAVETPGFIVSIEALLHHEDAEVRWRAQQVLPRLLQCLISRRGPENKGSGHGS